MAILTPRKCSCCATVFCQKRPVVQRNGTWIMIDDNRIPHDPSEVEMRMVRFRTLGCYPLSGAIESTAESVPEIIQENDAHTYVRT